MRLLRSIVVVLLVVGCSPATTTHLALAPSPGHSIVAQYEDATQDGTRAAQDLLQKRKLLETLASDATGLVKLPVEVPVIAKECGQANAFWSPAEHSITMCYELVADYQRMFGTGANENVDDDVIGATTSVFYHELGHGLVSLFDLPITGKEEDAVDQLSALLLTWGGDVGEDMLLSAAKAWRLMANEDEEFSELHFADEHSLSAQRYYNLLCYLYGSDPAEYEFLVSEDYLPQERAGRCQHEYDQIHNAWSTLLQPHFKN